MSFTATATNTWEIRYFTPYTREWRSQYFSSESEARAMVQFYRSCGSPARLVIG